MSKKVEEFIIDIIEHASAEAEFVGLFDDFIKCKKEYDDAIEFVKNASARIAELEDALKHEEQEKLTIADADKAMIGWLREKVSELEEATMWIPVDERLPEKSYSDLGDEKIVQIGYPFNRVVPMKFIDDRWFTGSYNMTDWTKYVVRWRELPQLLEVEE